MPKFDENEYRREVDKIHVPEDLVERTRAAMLAEELRLEGKPKKMLRRAHRWGRYAAAACIGFLIFAGYGVYRYQSDNDIQVQELAVFDDAQDDGWEIGMSLGQTGNDTSKEGAEEENDNKGFRISLGEDKSIVPKELWEAPKSRIKGIDVYITHVKEGNVYYAAWKKGEAYCLAEAENVAEKDFLKDLKKNIVHP